MCVYLKENEDDAGIQELQGCFTLKNNWNAPRKLFSSQNKPYRDHGLNCKLSDFSTKESLET